MEKETQSSTQPQAPNRTSSPGFGRRKKLHLVLAALGAAALVGGTVVSTASAHGGRGFGKGRGIAKMLRHADLTEAQETKVKAIHEKYKPAFEAEREDGKKTRHGFHALLTADRVDAKKAEVLRQEFLEHQNQKSAIMRDMMLELANVLTPAQRKKLAAKMKERHEHRAERHERRGKHQGMRNR